MKSPVLKIARLTEQLNSAFEELKDYIVKHDGLKELSAEEILHFYAGAKTSEAFPVTFNAIVSFLPMTYEEAFAIVKAKQEKEAEERLKKMD